MFEQIRYRIRNEFRIASAVHFCTVHSMHITIVYAIHCTFGASAEYVTLEHMHTCYSHSLLHSLKSFYPVSRYIKYYTSLSVEHSSRADLRFQGVFLPLDLHITIFYSSSKNQGDYQEHPSANINKNILRSSHLFVSSSYIMVLRAG